MITDPNREVYAKAAEVSPPPVCWLDPDDGEDYCPTCAEAKAMGPHQDGQDRTTEGGWFGQSPRDGAVWCSRCGCILDYDLSDIGAAQEASHFADCAIPKVAEMSPALAYQIVAVWSAQGRYPDAST